VRRPDLRHPERGGLKGPRLAFARDLLNSDYAGHRLTFIQFAQAPHFNHLAAVYGAFDFSGPLDFVRRAAGLSERVKGSAQ
jgi:4-hydroxyphenylacetate 3-monooxygenase